jgi:hypothetical protein
LSGTRQQFEQTGFTGAVATNERDSLARVQGERDAVEQRDVAEGERNLV